VRTGDDNINFKCLGLHSGIILLASYVLLLAFISACGRRADPVLLPSYDEKALSDDASQDADEQSEKGKAAGAEEEMSGMDGNGSTGPDSPSGLAALYTGKSIVITWREVRSPGVKKYNVYRDAGEGYTLIGETVSPAFTDRDIKQGMSYYYQVKAVGQAESLPSEALAVSTEIE